MSKNSGSRRVRVNLAHNTTKEIFVKFLKVELLIARTTARTEDLFFPKNTLRIKTKPKHVEIAIEIADDAAKI
jgi:hypothetical protein